VDDDQAARLFDLADSILAVSRLLYAPKAHAAGTWTPLESAVMRVIDRNPGTTARAAADATRLISSNFSRALRSLEDKGLVHRVPDEHDARRVRLYTTDAAHENLRRLQDLWSHLLDGIVDDSEADAIIATLRRLETALGARSRDESTAPGGPAGSRRRTVDKGR